MLFRGINSNFYGLVSTRILKMLSRWQSVVALKTEHIHIFPPVEYTQYSQISGLRDKRVNFKQILY